MPKILVRGQSFSVPEPYAPGRVITQAEADVLNRILRERMARGIYKILGVEDGRSQDEIGEKVALFINDFVTTFSQGYDRLRAIHNESRRIAALTLQTNLYKKGENIASLTKEEREQRVAELAENEMVRREAERRVDDLAKIARGTHGAMIEDIS